MRQAITAAPDPRVVELGINAPWKQVLVPETHEALFVIYPKRQGYGLEAVPRELGSFENRRDLPAAWAGLEGDDLVAARESRRRCSATQSDSWSSRHRTRGSPAWLSSRWPR